MNNNSEANEWYRFAKMYANAASFLMEKRGPPYEAVWCGIKKVDSLFSRIS